VKFGASGATLLSHRPHQRKAAATNVRRRRAQLVQQRGQHLRRGRLSGYMGGCESRQTTLRTSRRLSFDDWLVRDFLRYLVDHLTTTYYTPGTYKAVGTGVGWYMQAKESLRDATLACQYGSRRLHVSVLLAGGVRQ
jgi:hypothetical protein